MLDLSEPLDVASAIRWCESRLEGVTMPGARRGFAACLLALRAQQEAEKSEPLTQEELRQMDGQPVFIEHDIFPKFNHVWMIWSNQVSDDNQDGLEGYGDFWRAYRRPPVKEAP